MQKSTTPQALIYYNTAFTNSSSDARPALIRETRNAAIIDEPAKWQASIVRFDASTNSIPIAVINQVGSPPGAATDCYITLNYLGVDYTQNVLLTKSQTTDFNFIFSYQHWLDDINNALATAFALLPGPPAGQSAPQFILDPATSLIKLYISSAYLLTAINPINISVNAPLFKYLRGFQAFFNGYNTFSRKDYDLIINPVNSLVLPAAGSRSNYPASIASANYTNYVEQETVNLGSWNPVRSLVITSELLPSRPEFVQSDIKSALQYNLAGSYQAILTDFVQDQTDAPAQRGVTVYLPTAEYRMMDLFGDNALYSIDFQLSWTDYNGNIYPVTLAPGETFGVKLLFRRRI